MENVRDIRSGTQRAVDSFVVGTVRRECTHAFQLDVDFGDDPGPWLAIGVNETVYTIGWPPATLRGETQ